MTLGDGEQRMAEEEGDRVAVKGAAIDPRTLVEWLIPRMTHFMVPRFIRVEAELPKTPTNKIQKVELRKEGVTPRTFDREAAGLAVKRVRLSSA